MSSLATAGHLSQQLVKLRLFVRKAPGLRLSDLFERSFQRVEEDRWKVDSNRWSTTSVLKLVKYNSARVTFAVSLCIDGVSQSGMQLLKAGDVGTHNWTSGVRGEFRETGRLRGRRRPADTRRVGFSNEFRST